MSSSVVSEFEGTLLKDPDPFAYFMLVAFEASGLVRFTALLLLWPAIKLLEWAGLGRLGLRLMAFAATAGVAEAEIEAAARAVLPKFFMDDVDMAAWRRFSRRDRRVVVTKMPRVFVERFAKEHLRADVVVGPEIGVNRRFGFATGFVDRGGDDDVAAERVNREFVDGPPQVGMGRSRASFLSLCEVQIHQPFTAAPEDDVEDDDNRPLPVIFHDGRLVKRPTPSTALLILLWIPLGVVLAAIRIAVGLLLPMRAFPTASSLFGGKVIVRGNPPPPPPPSGSGSGVLFVCTHRTLMDPVVLSAVLRRRVPAVTYSISRLSEILSPIPTVRLTRSRRADAERIKAELSRGDLAVCPEGTTCREPFLLRFSALFAELTDRIVPVAMNHRVGVFHATTARGWKALDPIFFLMNPRPVYEVTFLAQLPRHATCSAGHSPHDVANYVQRILAASLGFECTNFTRRDKYRILAGNDGVVSSRAAGNTTTTTSTSNSNNKKGLLVVRVVNKFVSAFKPFLIH